MEEGPDLAPAARWPKWLGISWQEGTALCCPQISSTTTTTLSGAILPGQQEAAETEPSLEE